MAPELHAKGGHAKQVVLEEREWAWVQMNWPLNRSIKHATAGDQLVGRDKPLMSKEEFPLEFTSLNIPFELRLLNIGTRLEMMDLQW